MRLCLQCNTTKYTKRNCSCSVCGNLMIQVDGRPLRKVVESLAQADLRIAFATYDAYETDNICVVELAIGFSEAYDKFIFNELPEHFEFISDKYGPSHYTLNYVLNHLGGPMSMVMFDYCNHPSNCASAQVKLKEVVSQLYDWCVDIKDNRWPVLKLGGYL